MSLNSMDEYWVPEHVKECLRGFGFILPLDDMEPWIRSREGWMGARGGFYDYRDKDGLGRVLGRCGWTSIGRRFASVTTTPTVLSPPSAS